MKRPVLDKNKYTLVCLKNEMTDKILRLLQERKIGSIEFREKYTIQYEQDGEDGDWEIVKTTLERLESNGTVILSGKDFDAEIPLSLLNPMEIAHILDIVEENVYDIYEDAE